MDLGLQQCLNPKPGNYAGPTNVMDSGRLLWLIVVLYVKVAFGCGLRELSVSYKMCYAGVLLSL